MDADRVRIPAFMGKCVACDTCVWDDDAAVYFSVRHLVPSVVDLRGRVPWAGIRVACGPCATFLGAAAADLPPPGGLQGRT